VYSWDGAQKCAGPKAGISLAYLRSGNNVSVATAERQKKGHDRKWAK